LPALPAQARADQCAGITAVAEQVKRVPEMSPNRH
jgi:hypothetical protein